MMYNIYIKAREDTTMKYTVVNMSTNERISCTTRDEGRELAVRLSIETPYLWYLMIESN